MADDDEWISARDAVTLLNPVAGGLYLAKVTIVEHANHVLIRSRAGRFIYGTKTKDNVELPQWFWNGGGEVARRANWNTGYFETTHLSKSHKRVDCKAYDVKFRRADIMKMAPASSAVEQPTVQTAKPPGKKIFIGHGHSLVWHELRNFIENSLHLPCDEFNAVPSAGIPIPVRLEQMLDDAAFAFLVLTAEDELADGKVQARMNVVHEAGLFQGRLGFRKAIVVLEEGCEKFSNIEGLGDIRFPKGSISNKFEEIRRVLEREGILEK